LNKNNIIISFVLIVFSVLAYIETYSFRVPTSKIFPRTVLITLFFLAISLIFVTIKNYKNAEIRIVRDKSINSRLLFYVFSGIFLYISAIVYLGFYLTTYIFMIIMMFFLGIRNILKLLLVSSLSLFIIYSIFSIIINVQTPKGIFF